MQARYGWLQAGWRVEAVFLGESKKWNLEGKTYDFLAIPSGLAEKMVMGVAFNVEGESWQVKKVLAILRGRMMQERNEEGTWLRLVDAKTVCDIERQLRRISEGWAWEDSAAS